MKKPARRIWRAGGGNFVPSGGDDCLWLSHFVAERLSNGCICDASAVDIQAVAQVLVIGKCLQALVCELETIMQRGVVQRMVRCRSILYRAF